MAAAGAAAHDVYGTVWRKGQARPIARRSSPAGWQWGPSARSGRFIAIIAGKNFNVQILVGLTFAVAASANFPVLLLALTWRRFNSFGAVTRIRLGARNLDCPDHPLAAGLVSQDRSSLPARQPGDRLRSGRIPRLPDRHLARALQHGPKPTTSTRSTSEAPPASEPRWHHRGTPRGASEPAASEPAVAR